MADAYLDLIKQRRSYYSLQHHSPIRDSRIVEIAQTVLLHTPSSLNCQSTRYVILLGQEHVKLWSIVQDCLKGVIAPIEYAKDQVKLLGRQEGYGTILLYEDLAVVHELETKFPRYAGYIPQFTEHNNAMQTFNLWMALELEGLGCNVAHYNPYIDQRVVAEWSVPSTWSLKAQLILGTPTGPPNPNKSFRPTEERLVVHGAEN